MSEWIRLQSAVFTHPKTRRVAKRTHLSPAAAAGHLACLWCWAQEFAPDGDLSRFDIEELEVGAGWEGEDGVLLAALIASGYIDETSCGLVIHDWQEHGGTLVARRTAERERSAARRKKQADQQATGGRPAADRRPTAGNTVHNNTDNTEQEDLTSADESTDESCTDLMVLDGALEGEVCDPLDESFEAFWTAYPRKEGKKPARTAWKHLTQAERVLATGVAELMDQLAASGRQEKRFIPHPTTFLHQKRWEDWRDGVPAGWQQPGEARSARVNSMIADAVRRMKETA